MNFDLDVPLPADVLVEGAVLLIRGVDEEGNAAWFVRCSGAPGNQWERIGFLNTYLSQMVQDANGAWQEEDEASDE